MIDKLLEMLRFIRTLSILTQSQQKELETHKRFKVPHEKTTPPSTKKKKIINMFFKIKLHISGAALYCDQSKARVNHAV